jgi:hypothetical protein
MITLKEAILKQMATLEKILPYEGERGKLLGKLYTIYENGKIDVARYITLFDMVTSDDSENGYIAASIINTSYKVKYGFLPKGIVKLLNKPQGLLKLNLDSHYTCYYCGLEHKDVEAGGIWGCPNISCLGPGGHYHRRNLKSYKEVEDGKHTIEILEYLDWIVENGKKIIDPAIKLAIGKSVRKWLT